MKKRMRKITCLLTIVMLISSFAVPATATATGNGTTNAGINYSWNITHDENSALAGISTSPQPAQVRVVISCDVYSSTTGREYSVLDDNSGYSSVIARIGNTWTVEGQTIDITILGAKGVFYVAGQWVASASS